MLKTRQEDQDEGTDAKLFIANLRINSIMQVPVEPLEPAARSLPQMAGKPSRILELQQPSLGTFRLFLEHFFFPKLGLEARKSLDWVCHKNQTGFRTELDPT